MAIFASVIFPNLLVILFYGVVEFGDSVFIGSEVSVEHHREVAATIHRYVGLQFETFVQYAAYVSIIRGESRRRTNTNLIDCAVGGLVIIGCLEIKTLLEEFDGET